MSPRTSTIKPGGGWIARAVLGIAVAGLAQILSIFLAGGGHGWNAPFLSSIALWLLVPTTLSLAWPPGSGNKVVPIALAAIALVADANLISGTISEAEYLLSYVRVNGGIGILLIALWLCLWTFWQAMLLYALTIGDGPTTHGN